MKLKRQGYVALSGGRAKICGISQLSNHLRLITGIAILGFAAVCLMVGCAPVRMEGYDGQTRIERDAARCLNSGDCTVLQIESMQFSDAAIYLNGSRFAFVNGLAHTTLFIPDSQLDIEHCATIVIRLMAGNALRLPRECVRRGGHFEMQILPLFSVSWIAGYNP